jgi:hypothetical protein
LAVDQKEFELSLEYRICLEFSCISESQLSNLWCDGVMLGTFLLDDPRPRILGTAWICEGVKQEEWRVELLLPKRLKPPGEVKWEQLLPPEDVTRWLAVDRQKKFVQIEPAAAVPDLK